MDHGPMVGLAIMVNDDLHHGYLVDSYANVSLYNG